MFAHFYTVSARFPLLENHLLLSVNKRGPKTVLKFFTFRLFYFGGKLAMQHKKRFSLFGGLRGHCGPLLVPFSFLNKEVLC